MSITINQTSTSQLKRRAQLSLPVLRKIATLNNKIKKIEEEIRENELLLSVDNEWAYKVFNKSITELILVNIVDGKTKLSYNPAFFNIEEVSYTDKNGRLIKKENVTWKEKEDNLPCNEKILSEPILSEPKEDSRADDNNDAPSVQTEEPRYEKCEYPEEADYSSEETYKHAECTNNDLETAFPEEI